MNTARPFIKPWSFKLLLVAALVAGLLLGGVSTAQSAQTQGGQLLTLTNTVSPNPATVGQPLTVTLTVTNTAPPSPVHTLQTPLVVDTLPPGMTVVSVTPGPGATPPFCNQDSGTVTCLFRDLNNGESDTATIVAIPTQCGNFTNTARGTFDAGTVPADFTVQGCLVLPETTAPPPGSEGGTDGTKLPGSGGPEVASLLVPASALLLGSGIAAYAVLGRRR